MNFLLSEKTHPHAGLYPYLDFVKTQRPLHKSLHQFPSNTPIHLIPPAPNAFSEGIITIIHCNVMGSKLGPATILSPKPSLFASIMQMRQTQCHQQNNFTLQNCI
jgi:hypothetical protein